MLYSKVSRESGVGSRESGVGSRESGVGSRESGVGSQESGVGINNYHNSYTDPYIALRIKVRTSLPISPS
ncbi:MAG: hypothetical protein F6K37_21485, partial [Moorea sp. SIO4E2]|uniref:hypothetical protein n=1 Tax=Moorena sp. SIO4E2 TaxID=2607826 RepID=UPI0013B9084A